MSASDRAAEREQEWNEANARLQALLAADPALNGYAVEVEPTFRLLVVVEPDRALSAASTAQIAVANGIRPVVAVPGVTPKAELERARDAVERATQRVRAPHATKGLRILTDYLAGRVRITGDLEHGRAIATEAALDDRLLIVEDGPGIRRLPRPPLGRE